MENHQRRGLKAAVFVLFCGTFLAGQAMAANIYVWGTNSVDQVVSFLEGAGHNVESSADDPGAAELDGQAILINLRQPSGDTTNVANWINAGGCMITEWQGTRFAADIGMGITDEGGGLIATGTEVTINAAGVSAGSQNCNFSVFQGTLPQKSL